MPMTTQFMVTPLATTKDTFEKKLKKKLVQMLLRFQLAFLVLSFTMILGLINPHLNQAEVILTESPI